jgi:signal transduction histidine kinase
MDALKVLVADDEFGMRAGAARIIGDYRFSLEGFDDVVAFEVLQAATGNEALHLLQKHKPDILILDYKLPDILGLDVLRRTAQENNDVTTIMVTAYASLDVAISATKLGAFDFLSKPFTPDELRTTVRKAARHIFLHRKALALENEKRQVRFQFLSVLAHELKSPLNAIDGYLKIMASRTAGEELADYDDMIRRSSVRIEGMRRMIVDLLDLTRIESGKRERGFGTLSLPELMKDAAEGVTPAAKARFITIALEAPDGLCMEGDRSEIEMILNNLLSNAVKYNREGGSVSLSACREGDSVLIRCADTGIGMKPKDVARLFGEFVRIKDARTKGVEGSGLGLSILKKLVDLYGGRVDVHSAPDVGTAFEVRLPADGASFGAAGRKDPS